MSQKSHDFKLKIVRVSEPWVRLVWECDCGEIRYRTVDMPKMGPCQVIPASEVDA